MLLIKQKPKKILKNATAPPFLGGEFKTHGHTSYVLILWIYKNDD